MTLKTYRASSMAEALAAVKRDLGRDAVILHTRNFRKGGFLGFGGRQMWEITASRNVNVPAPARRRAALAASQRSARRADEADGGGVAVIDGPAHLGLPDAPAMPIAGPDDSAAGNLAGQMQTLTQMVETLVRQNGRQGRPDVPEELFEMYLNLTQQEVSDDIAREVLQNLRAQLTGEQLKDPELIRGRMMDFLTGMIPTSALEARRQEDRPSVIALIGPTGVGKTTTIAKLAANFKLREGKRVGLVTIDTYRIAAVEQLRTYAQIIDVPLKVVLTPRELTAAIAEMSDRDVVLIDTAGRSPSDAMRLAQLQQFLKAARPDQVHLVLSTTASPRSVQATMEKFAPLGVDRLILTKLDEAVSFGMILNVVRRMNAALSYVTTGQDVPDDIEVTQARKIAELILKGSAAC